MKGIPRSICLNLLCCRLIAGFAILALAGCGSSQGGSIVSGQVTLDGQPLANGQIVFEPQGQGKMSVAQIGNGDYCLPKSFGLQPGTYTVRITSLRSTGQKVKPASYSQDQTPAEVYEQFLPAKYNQSSELIMTVDPSSDLTHDFALSSK
jgi:hypothetical protein